MNKYSLFMSKSGKLVYAAHVSVNCGPSPDRIREKNINNFIVSYEKSGKHPDH